MKRQKWRLQTNFEDMNVFQTLESRAEIEFHEIWNFRAGQLPLSDISALEHAYAPKINLLVIFDAYQNGHIFFLNFPNFPKISELGLTPAIVFPLG